MDADSLSQHRGMVCRFLLFLTQDTDASEELTQEVFRVALSKGTDPAKGEDYGAWLRSIARNVLRNYRRKHRGTWLVFDSDIVERAEQHFVRAGADRDGGWVERREALAVCMRALAEDERHVLHRRYSLGHQVKAIAADLGMRQDALSKRLERIRDALRRCIEARLKGELS